MIVEVELAGPIRELQPVARLISSHTTDHFANVPERVTGQVTGRVTVLVTGRARCELALSTIFQNLNQNTLGLMVYQKSSKYFRVGVQNLVFSSNFDTILTKSGQKLQLVSGINKTSC